MPLADNATLPVKPPEGVIVTSVVPCWPRAMRRLFGDAAQLSSFGCAPFFMLARSAALPGTINERLSLP